MKSLVKLFAAIFIALLFSETKAEPVGNNSNVSFSYFYDRLSSQGQWFELDDGVVVWRPSGVSNNWSPYSNGSWTWTRYGWYWDSYEPYGDIVYHYGRWFNDDYYGWIWVPDYDWAPAWVQWRYDDDYIGWTPLPPYAKFGIATGIIFTHSYSIHYNHWNFVPFHKFCDPYVSHYFVRERVKYRVFDHTREHINYRYEDNVAANRGLDRETIEKRSRTTVTQRDVVFRDAASIKGRGSRTRGNTIEVGIPKTDTRTRSASELNIKRGEKSTTLNTSRVEIGERTRTSIEKTDTRKTGSTNTPADTRIKTETPASQRDVERGINKNPATDIKTRETRKVDVPAVTTRPTEKVQPKVETQRVESRTQPARVEKVEQKKPERLSPPVRQEQSPRNADRVQPERKQERVEKPAPAARQVEKPAARQVEKPAARQVEKPAPSSERERKSDTN